jgi:hypothetical protein
MNSGKSVNSSYGDAEGNRKSISINPTSQIRLSAARSEWVGIDTQESHGYRNLARKNFYAEGHSD